MLGWQRNIKSLLQNLGKRVEYSYSQASNLCSSRAGPFRTEAELPCLQRYLKPSSSTILRPFHQFHQQSGISTSRKLLADVSNETPVQSPLLSIGSGIANEELKKAVVKPEKVQAVLKKIKMSPKKLNLVAALVRGMTVEDALLQLQVRIKRAAKTVYQVIHSARANATHNHGLDGGRLIVAEAFVGKGVHLKRISYHSKGRSGVKERYRSRLTVIVREMTPKEEAMIAKLRVQNYRKLTKRQKQLIPHKLMETTSVWNRHGYKNDNYNGDPTSMPAFRVHKAFR